MRSSGTSRASRARVKLRVVFALGLAATPLSSGGCAGNCLATCVSDVSASGHLAIEVTDVVPLAVELCFGATCRTVELVYSADQTGYCVSADVQCSLTSDPAGGSTLELTLRVGEGTTLDTGLQATVHIERTDTAEVLVDVSRPLSAVTPRVVCGQRCESGAVTWDAPP